MRQFLRDEELSLKEFSEKIGVNYRTLQNYLGGISTPSGEFLIAANEEYGVSIKWLLKGDGEMYDAESMNKIHNEHTRVAIPRRDLPVAAGLAVGLQEEHEPDEYLSFSNNWIKKNHFDPQKLSFVYVKGDSMVPELDDGDLVLIDEREVTAPTQIKIYCVRTEDGVSLKRVRREGGNWCLLSRNPNYPIYYYSEIDIIGTVVWRGQAFNKR